MKTSKRLGAATTLAVVALLGLSQFATSGTVDAVSAASLKVTGGSTTANSATINLTFTETNGTWRLFYDVVDHTSYTAFTKYTQTSGKSGTMTITVTGLNSGTKYYYWLQGYERLPTADKSKVHASFTTDGASSVLRRIPASTGSCSFVDPLGRSISQQRGFAPVQIDPAGTGIRIEPTAP